MFPDENGEQSTEIIEAVADTVETVLENQEVQAEHAAEISEMLVEAAVEGERGERIAELEHTIAEMREDQIRWQLEQQELMQRLLTEQLTAMRLEMTETLLAATQSQSIQPEPDPLPIVVESVDVQPEAEPPAPEIPSPAPPKRKRLFL